MPNTSVHSVSERRRVRRLWTTFNLLPEEYDRIIAHQDGRCAICKTIPPDGKRLAVEHDHKSGLIRGGTCWPCNKLLAAARDFPALLLAAAQYLTLPPAIAALGHPQYGFPGRVGTKKQRKLAKRRTKLAKRGW